MKTCTTCNVEVTHEYVEFKCPSCGKTHILRCDHCRETIKPYKCSECGFEGP